MDFTLYVGDFAYSSWSLRGWLLLDGFGLPFDLRHAHMRTPAFRAQLDEIAPARLVPALALSDQTGRTVVWESLAIAETVHEHHPQAGLWPMGGRAKPVARAIAAEMHAGFQALRSACPMNMRRTYAGFRADDAVRADLERIAGLWAHARARRTGDGPFLFGSFSAADAFYAPVASRIATYDLPVPAEAAEYVAAVLSHASVRRWRAMAFADGHVQQHYEMDLPTRPDPHAPAFRGTVTSGGTTANATCPFTGAVPGPDHQVEVQGRTLGFGDAFTAAKVAADPLAWAEVAALLHRAPTD